MLNRLPMLESPLRKSAHKETHELGAQAVNVHPYLFSGAALLIPSSCLAVFDSKSICFMLVAVLRPHTFNQF